MKFAKLALAGIAAIAATTALAASNWLTTVDTAGGGHRIGNPAAKVKLTEFVSYTCTHCGEFAQEGSNALDVYVATGKVQLDVRHVVRDPVDLTAAMLANCGPAAKFPRNHAALILSQPKWLPVAQRATAGQKSRWYNGPGPERRRAIAADLKFYDTMIGRGYERVALDRCLSDEALAKRLTDQSAADGKKWGVTSTPSFAIDGTMLAGTSTWNVLQVQLDARL
ncbi:DsbA family protein [Tsuneonella sp. HG249]